MVLVRYETRIECSKKRRALERRANKRQMALNRPSETKRHPRQGNRRETLSGGRAGGERSHSVSSLPGEELGYGEPFGNEIRSILILDC